MKTKIKLEKITFDLKLTIPHDHENLLFEYLSEKPIEECKMAICELIEVGLSSEYTQEYIDQSIRTGIERELKKRSISVVPR